MTIELPHQHYSDFAPSVTGSGETASTSLDAVDYGNPEAVNNARHAIMRLDVWSSFGDWGFQQGREQDAVEAFADTLLCEKAVTWQRDNPGRQPVEGLSEKSRQGAQATFLAFLSPRGAEAITGQQEVTPDGMRFMPNTGIAELNSLLSAALVHGGTTDRQVQSATGDFGGGGWGFDALEDAEFMGAQSNQIGDYAAAADCYESAARWAESHNEPERAKADWANAADNRDLEAWAKNAARQPGEAAKAFEAAASAYMASGHPDEAKEALLKAAEAWDLEASAQDRAGHPDLAAQAYEKKAAARTAAGQAELAKADWRKAASEWIKKASLEQSAGHPALAAAAYEKAAAASEAAGSQEEVEMAYGKAAEQWRAAGRPELAAVAFEKQAAAWRALHNHWMAWEALEKAAAAWYEAGEPGRAQWDQAGAGYTS